MNGMCTLGPRACGMWRYAVVKAWLPAVQGNFSLEKIRNENIHKAIPYIVKTGNTTFQNASFPIHPTCISGDNYTCSI